MAREDSQDRVVINQTLTRSALTTAIEQFVKANKQKIKGTNDLNKIEIVMSTRDKEAIFHYSRTEKDSHVTTADSVFGVSIRVDNAVKKPVIQFKRC